ncbi:MAG: phosphopantothenate/pantothenate synthetase [bacterium]|nr:phosphopantothenate/pantothenate synthetase [bacterium]
MKIPSSHPRARSLRLREKIVSGVEMGITSVAGLIAQGRGEAFDYLLGEKTHPFAKKAIRAAAGLLVTARHPVISVNGNVAALAGKQLSQISNRFKIPLEVNLFHYSREREKKIVRYLKKCGAKTVLCRGAMNGPPTLKGLHHARKYMHPDGIAKADVVFIPLEDGDRCQALRKAGKKVIAVDLNPLSRTARTAHLTIVDELTRVLEGLSRVLKRGAMNDAPTLKKYNNKSILKQAEKRIRRGQLF